MNQRRRERLLRKRRYERRQLLDARRKRIAQRRWTLDLLQRKFLLKAEQTAVIHQQRLATIGYRYSRSRNNLKAFGEVPDMDIVTIHDREGESLFEKGLALRGLRCTVVRPEVIRPDRSAPKHLWQLVRKIPAMAEFVSTCRAEYVLHCDAFDCFLCKEPGWILDYFKTSGYRALYSSTNFRWGGPDQGKAKRRYLNAGVYVAETEFLKILFERALEMIRTKVVVSNLEQPYFRQLEIEYPTEIGVDDQQKLAWRNK